MNITLIGAGNIARHHARGIADAGHTIKLVCDAVPEAARALAEATGARWTADLEEALSSSADLVTVTVPNVHHFAVAKRAVEAGHAVLCEKPMTRDIEHSRALVALVKEKGTPFFVGYMKRTHPAAQKFKEWAGKLGTPRSGLVRVYHPFPIENWDFMREKLAADPAALRNSVFNDGVFVNGGSHMMDLLLWTAGPVKRILGARLQVREGCTTDTAAHALLEMESGASVFIECGWLPLTGVGRRENGWDESLELRGDEGQAIFHSTWWDRPQTEVPVAEWWNERAHTRETFNVGSVDTFAEEYRCIERALRGETTLLATVADGLRADELMAGVFEKAREQVGTE